MEQGTILALSIIGALLICVIIYLTSNKKSKKELELDARLEDETILVGEQRVALEQTEGEEIVADEYRIKSVEEIERIYEGDQLEVELIYRDLDILNKWADEEDAFSIVQRSPQFQEYKSYELAAVAHYGPNVIMGLISVHYEYSIGSRKSEGAELQPFYIVKGNTELKRFKTIPEVIVEQVDDNIVIRLPKKAKHLMFRHLAMEIEKLLYIDTFR